MSRHVPSSQRSGWIDDQDQLDRWLDTIAEDLAAAEDRLECDRLEVARLRDKWEEVSQWRLQPAAEPVPQRVDARVFPSAGADERETWREVS